MPPKARSQRRHTTKRAAQRYDLHLTHRDLEGIVRDIRENRARLVERQSNRVSLYEVKVVKSLDDVWRHIPESFEVVVALVAYDNHRQQISSFLPPR